MLAWITNLGMGGGGAVVVVADVDKGKDAGSGRRKEWWEGTWITPGVDAYLPTKPPEDITPLRPQLEKVKAALKQVPVDGQTRWKLSARVAGLARSVAAIERRAANVVRAKNVEKAIEETIAKYREIQAKIVNLEDMISRQDEAIKTRRKRILADDERFLEILMELI